jgi:hypothetical protein
MTLIVLIVVLELLLIHAMAKAIRLWLLIVANLHLSICKFVI